jgi:tetratricopeptide (TPR) repeat protein
MRKFILFICLLGISCGGVAQQKIIDSLKLAIKKYNQQDTVKLNMLTDLVFYYKDIDPAKGIETANEALQLATLLHDQKRLANVYNYMALNYTNQGNDTTALEFFNKCLAIRKQANDENGIAVVKHNMGISFFNLANYPLALQYQRDALSIFKKTNNNAGMASSLNSIGVIFLYLSDYPKALDHYLQALHIYEQTGDEQRKGSAFTNIGLVYNKLNDYDKALEYYFKASDIAKKYDDQYGLQNLLTNIGNTYDNSGEAAKALTFYQQALAINETLGNNRGIASNLINTGIVYSGIENYEMALDYLKKSLTLYEQLNDKYGMSIALSYISQAYAKAPANVLAARGINFSQRYERAIALQQKGLQMAQETGNLITESEAWQNLSDIYTDQKDFPKALVAYKNYVNIHDSIFSNERKSEINRMAMQYDFDKKEAISKANADKKQALANAEIRKQRIVRNTIAVGAGLLVLAIVFIFAIYKKKRDAVEKHKEAELKAQVADTEMKALRAQMNPHFIFNSLNSISDYIAKQDIKTADRYLIKFAKMMRLILENSEHKQISLAEDLKALELYMQLEALRLNDKFSYEIKIDDEIDQDITMIPPLILQPFVENSIWRGIAQKEGGGKILIEIKKENEMINCAVEDNGLGRNHLMQYEPNGISKKSLGMKITRSRIDILNQPGKTRGAVELLDLAKGMRVEIKFPLALNF